jgi:dienelactone hydrolase
MPGGVSTRVVGLRVLAAAVVASVVAAGAISQNGSASASSPGTFTVNTASQTFVDGSRGTPARQGVPASPTRTIHELIYVPASRAGPLPTVVFAPGWNNQSSTYDPLLRTIASAGYLVVGVDSPGSSNYFLGTQFSTPAGDDIANNTLDLSVALNNLESGPLGGRVDRTSVAAVGHSNGGSVVATLALDTSFVSSRFNAYVVLSGAIPSNQVPGSFGAHNNGPLLAMVGTADEFGNYRPPGGGPQSVYNIAGPSRVMVTISGASHLSAFIGAGAQADDTRAAITNFLNVVEQHDTGAQAAFNSEVTSNGLSAQEDLSPSWYSKGAVVGMATTADGNGYWIARRDGTVQPFGDAAALGSVSQPEAPIVAITGTPDGKGYWLTTATGAVYSFGDAAYHGGVNGVRLNALIVAMTADPATGGYWLLGADGGVFSFDAPFFGSTGNIRLVAPAVGMTATADGRGYYFVAADGGVFSYGDAAFHGSMGGHHLNEPVVGMALDAASGGYWLDASDGGVFAFNAPFEGSLGAVRLVQPCVAMTGYPAGPGYRLVASDGGIFSFNAPFFGSGA